jgi:hypothetical protein
MSYAAFIWLQGHAKKYDKAIPAELPQIYRPTHSPCSDACYYPLQTSVAKCFTDLSFTLLEHMKGMGVCVFLISQKAN